MTLDDNTGSQRKTGPWETMGRAGGRTEDAIRVELSSFLEHLGGDGDCGVDWVGNDVHPGVGAVLSDALWGGGRATRGGRNT